MLAVSSASAQSPAAPTGPYGVVHEYDPQYRYGEGRGWRGIPGVACKRSWRALNSGIVVPREGARPDANASGTMSTDQSRVEGHTPVLYINGGPNAIEYKNALDDFARIDRFHGGGSGQSRRHLPPGKRRVLREGRKGLA
jgi:hypothetical protein